MASRVTRLSPIYGAGVTTTLLVVPRSVAEADGIPPRARLAETFPRTKLGESEQRRRYDDGNRKRLEAPST
jgi:hypothetical protein